METSDKSFSELPVSTRTIIAYTNFSFNLKNIFDNLPLVDVEGLLAEKKKPSIPPGSIYAVKLGKKVRGYTENKRSFFNSLTFSMFVWKQKLINIKVFTNGTLHITGCKSDDQLCMKAIYYFYRALREGNEEYGYYEQDDIGFNRIVNVPDEGQEDMMRFTLTTVMKNVNFQLGFNIDLIRLNTYFRENTEFLTTFDPDFNTGCNLKLECTHFKDLPILYVRIHPNRTVLYRYITISDILDTRMKKKDKFATFLVFTSGKCIMISPSWNEMEEQYQTFLNNMNEHREEYSEGTP